MTEILAFAGSFKKESLNKKLINSLKSLEVTCQINVVELEDFALPLFNEDLEGKLDDVSIKRLAQLREKIHKADGLIVSVPEYNGMMPGVLKNTLDWLSRPFDQDDFGNVFLQKPLMLTAVSPGAMGGVRTLANSRDTFYYLGALIMPQASGNGRGKTLFGDDGLLNDERTIERLTNNINKLESLATALK